MGKPETGLTIVLVGCGTMGSALLKGWLPLSYLKIFKVITPHQESVVPFLKDPRVHWLSSPQELSQPPDVIVFAVKPSLLKEILPLYKSFNSLILSVAAGKPVSFYESYLPNRSIIRVMPNLPVAIHEGVIALLANKNVTSAQKYIVDSCFQKLGLCLWVKNDEEVDKITAISGSGPAYVYYFIELLTKATETLGFDEKTALTLALQTFRGASLYVEKTKQHPTILRQHITTPGGTTAAALQILEEGSHKSLMEKAVKAAFERAKDLQK